MKSLGIGIVVVCAAVLAVVSSSTAGEVPAAAGGSENMALALAIGDLSAPRCGDGRDTGDHCGIAGERVASGSECPAASGAYCSDEFPYCCGTPGNYYCATDVNGC